MIISINPTAFVDTVSGNAPITSKVGYALDQDGTSYGIFVRTTREEPNKPKRDKNNQVLLNVRPSKTQSLGNRLPARQQPQTQQSKTQEELDFEALDMIPF